VVYFVVYVVVYSDSPDTVSVVYTVVYGDLPRTVSVVYIVVYATVYIETYQG
jgi:hypothetical protein